MICFNQILRIPTTGSLRSCFALVVLTFVLGSSSLAAPITFRFDGTINTVFPGIPFDSGLDFSEGQVMSGAFTFQPSDGDGNQTLVRSQPYSVRLTLNGVTLSTSSFEIVAHDDVDIYDYEQATILDELELKGAGLFGTDSSTPYIAPPHSTFRLTLRAGENGTNSVSVLEPAYIPGVVDVWNHFLTERSLQVVVRDGMGGALGFSAALGEFSAVPEPHMTHSLFMAILALSAINRYRQ